MCSWALLRLVIDDEPSRSPGRTTSVLAFGLNLTFVCTRFTVVQTLIPTIRWYNQAYPTHQCCSEAVLGIASSCLPYPHPISNSCCLPALSILFRHSRLLGSHGFFPRRFFLQTFNSLPGPSLTHSQLHRLTLSSVDSLPAPSSSVASLLPFVTSSPHCLSRRPVWWLFYRPSINIDQVSRIRSQTLCKGLFCFYLAPFVHPAAYFVSDLSASKYSNLDNTPSSQLLRRLHLLTLHLHLRPSSARRRTLCPIYQSQNTSSFIDSLSTGSQLRRRPVSSFVGSPPGPSLTRFFTLHRLASISFVKSTLRHSSTVYLVSDLSASK